MSTAGDAKDFEEAAKGLIVGMAIQPADVASRIAAAQVYATLALVNEVRIIRRAQP